MKKIFTTLALALTIGSASAQFFTNTPYRGAFAPSPTTMWTGSWVQWDPQAINYGTPSMTITTDVTANAVWSGTVLLAGQIYVKGNSTLTILPGTVIQGKKCGGCGNSLIISKGSKIMAVGTATNPIIFTSDQPAGARSVGDWGGIAICGNAAINYSIGVNNLEGFTASVDNEYGSLTPNNADNSGVLSYVRIEYGGFPLAANKEINGLTMGGVGNGTTIDHIQCSFINDDAFEWFGGSVSAKYLVAYRCLDDNWDTDNGWSGYVQFALGVRDPNISDNPTVSTSEGFESDNDAAGTFTATPLTTGIFSNVTDIGPMRGVSTTTFATTSGFFTSRGARIRRSSNLRIYNSLLMDHVRGIYIDGVNSQNNATGGTLKFKTNIVAGVQQAGKNTEISSTGTNNAIGWNAPAYFGANFNDSIATTAGILIAPYSYTVPDYRPSGASIAAAGASYTDAIIAPLTASATGITEVKKQIGTVFLYPNPAANSTALLINANIVSVVNIELFDVTGKRVAVIARQENVYIGMNEIQINTAELTSGVYFVTIQSSLGKETVKLLISK